MKKILVIRFSSLGDLVLTTPIFREIKKVFPNSRISVLTSSDLGSIFENNPHIDRLIKFKRKDTLGKLNKLIKNLRDEKFDLIYDAHRSLRSIWIVWNIIGFGFFKFPRVWIIKKRSIQKNLLIFAKLNFLKNYSSQRTHLLRPLKENSNIELKYHTELFPGKNTEIFVKKFLKKNGLFPKKFIAIGPSASYPIKCWPLSYFYKLISKLIEKDWPVVIVGGKNEFETSKIEKKFYGKLQNVAGKFSILESAELLNQARLTITNDTSICHLSEAMDTPAFVFFGPTVKEFGYGPYIKESRLIETFEKLKCRPCSKDGRGKCLNFDHLKCLTTIYPERVVSLIPDLEEIEKK